MKPNSLAIAALIAVLATPVATHSAIAQAPCSVLRAVVDSAREDALAVLNSERPLVVELRNEQGMSRASDLAPIAVVRDRYVCAHMAGAFDRVIAPGIGFAVLRIGHIYYARDPDQRRGTGVITDTTFHVLMRLGAAMPPGELQRDDNRQR
jgi:hypothetical protein